MRVTADKKAYTLIEAVISIAISAVVFVSLGMALSSGRLIATANRSNLYSLDALTQELETIRHTPYDTFVAYGTTSTFANAELAKLQGGSGTRSIQNTSFGADIKKLSLTVAWTSNGRTLQRRLTTYVTRRGINGS